MSKKPVDVPFLVHQTINQFKGSDGTAWLHPDDPFMAAAMRAYIAALDDTGEYVALTRQAKTRYTELFGEW